MKPRKISKKLRFNKKTISNLNNNEMKVAYAGILTVEGPRCESWIKTNCGCETEPITWCGCV